MTPEFIKFIQGGLDISKNAIRQAGERSKQENISLHEVFKQAGRDLDFDINQIKQSIDSIPDSLEKRLIDDSYQELLDLIASYDIKQ